MENKFPVNNWKNWYTKEQGTHIKPRSGFWGSYDIFLCDSIFARYLPFNNGNKKDVKICEIGSGDGKLLKKISDSFNYDPTGIEYSKEAIERAKSQGVETVQGDIFDIKLLERYRGYFDVVYSYGFIEHIMPPEKALDVHLQILKKGGYLLIQVPRIKGFNYLKIKIFRPDLIPLHNLNLMEENSLMSICKREDVEALFCKNYGTFKLRVPLAIKNFRWYILKTICLLEYLLNPLCRLIFKDKGFETRLFSPGIIFIGRKIK